MGKGLLSGMGMESLDFQNPAFFNELTLVFDEMKAFKKKEALQDSELVGQISKVIEHHTGLQIIFELENFGPAVQIPDVHKNNPLVSSFARNWLSNADGMRMVTNGAVRGSVNLKTGKVTGIFTELKAHLYFPFEMITGAKYTADECAAITLHEVGHLFVYFEFLSRTVTTNQVLAGITRTMDSSATQKERETVLLSVKKSKQLSELDVDALTKSNNSKVVEMVVLSNIIRETESELGSNIYDANNWEYLADQYAARQGAGRQLAIALDKLYRGAGNISFRSMPTFLAMEAIKLMFLLGGIVWMPPLAFAAVMLIAIDSAGDGTYDRPGVRIRRIRNQILEALKDKKLDKESAARLTDDLAIIDKHLEDINDRHQFFGVIANFLSSDNRKRFSAEKLQQELETLAANDLFAKAKELKQYA